MAFKQKTRAAPTLSLTDFKGQQINLADYLAKNI